MVKFADDLMFIDTASANGRIVVHVCNRIALRIWKRIIEATLAATLLNRSLGMMFP